MKSEIERLKKLLESKKLDDKTRASAENRLKALTEKTTIEK